MTKNCCCDGLSDGRRHTPLWRQKRLEVKPTSVVMTGIRLKPAVPSGRKNTLTAEEVTQADVR
ncbi:hypothetical protein KCP69_02885 [Salmonella enterica subsp. enterica]|nr:hypothetical protein KCP69_02885 [Salmonella enterica subsp. enterica]